MRGLVLLDLFCGIGGFPLGLQEAGFSFSKHYFSEVDLHAIACYHHHFKTAINLGAVEQIKASKIERPDIVTFGFPCQDLSLAGRQKGLKGKKSRLFFEAVRLIKELKPPVIIFENVKGLFSINKGKEFETVIKTIADLGLYHCQWQLLNSAWFLPQNRERIYFVGTIGNQPPPQIFPFTGSDSLFKTGIKRKGQENKDIASALTTSYHKGVQGRGETYIATAKPFILAMRRHNEKRKGYRVNARPDGRSNTITSVDKDNYLSIKNKIRRLTPLECERLQGFPDNWTQTGKYDKEKKEISDTQRYIMCGNAVSVPVVKAVGEKLIADKNFKWR